MSNLRRIIKASQKKKQDQITALPALLGDGYGNITTSIANKVYVRIHGQKTTAVCEGIPQLNDLPVWVGYEPYEPNVLRVLRIRTVSSEVDVNTGIGKHAETHRFFGDGAAGGSDMLWVDHRQILPLRMYGVPESLSIAIYPAVVLIDGVPVLIGTFADGEYTAATVDLSDYIITTADKAKIVLITIDDSGDLVATEGSEVDITALDLETDTPAVPASTKWVLGAVRMYYSQTEFLEGRNNTDIMDWRFPMYHTHDSSEVSNTIDNLTDVTITSIADNEILQYDSGLGVWINQTLIEAELLNPVLITSVADNEVLQYDSGSSKWINQTLAEADIATESDLTTDEGNLSTHIADDTNPHDVTIDQVTDYITDSDGYVKVGDVDGTDYLRVDEITGSVMLLGEATSYKDLNKNLIGQRLESPSSHVTQDGEEGSLVFDDTSDLTDYASMNIQMQHDWKIESEISPHLHWWQTSADMPNWLLQYRWQIQGNAKTTAWTSLAWEANVYTYTSGTLNQITEFPDITAPAGSGLSDIVQFRLLRDTDNDSSEFDGADPLTGDTSAVDFDVHYEVDSFGSDNEYIKDTSNKFLDDDDEFITDSDGVILEE